MNAGQGNENHTSQFDLPVLPVTDIPLPDIPLPVFRSRLVKVSWALPDLRTTTFLRSHSGNACVSVQNQR